MPYTFTSAYVGFDFEIVILSVNLIKGNIMTVIELKEKIIAKISNTDNEDLLEHISDLIDFESNEIHAMSPDEIDAVKDGIRQIENGQSISHEEVKRQMNEWLKK